MRSAAVYLLSLGLAFIGFAADVPSVNELTETLSRGPWAELPVRAVAAVRHAKEADRKETTIGVVKAALGLNPASATAPEKSPASPKSPAWKATVSSCRNSSNLKRSPPAL